MTTFAGRLFASHYQFVVCDSTDAEFLESDNWNAASIAAGFAGNDRFRMIGTCADLNDHWFVGSMAPRAPDFSAWDRITCAPFTSTTGCVNIMSIIDQDPLISLAVEQGDYSIYAACNNPGVDQSYLDETIELSDEQISKRNDLEWYHVFLVPGRPVQTGILKDTELQPRHSSA